MIHAVTLILSVLWTLIDAHTTAAGASPLRMIENSLGRVTRLDGRPSPKSAGGTMNWLLGWCSH